MRIQFDTNQDIRDYARQNHIFMYEIAGACHYCEGYFSRILHYELTEAQKEIIKNIIDELASGNKGYHTDDFRKTVRKIKDYSNDCPICFKIYPTHKDTLKAEARERHISLTKLMIEIVEEHLKKEKSK